MSHSNLIRAIAFSHREPFLISLLESERAQVVAQLIEAQKGGFTVTVSIFTLSSCISNEETRLFPSIGVAMDWIIQIFNLFESHGPPEVLYLPEWSAEETVEECMSTWTETLFGLDNSFNLIPKFEKADKIVG